MAVDWLTLLGWNEEQLEDLRVTGYSYLQDGLYDRALTFFEALTSINPQSSYDHQTLGALYLQMGRHLEALDTLNRALGLTPGHFPSVLNKAKVLLLLGEVREGLLLARSLVVRADEPVRSRAEALVMAYG